MKINTRFFHENGFLIIRNFYSKKLIYKIKKDIFEISKEIYKKYNKKFSTIKYNPDDFEYFVLKSRNEKKSEVTSAIYDACKKLRGFYEIISNKKLLTIAEKLTGSKRLGILPGGFGVRIDYPKDRYWKARLHQDYTSQLGSPNGIVCYTPLGNLTQKKGPVILYTGSHKKGVFETKINLNGLKKKQTYDPYYIKISKKELKRYKIKYLNLKETDLGIFHFLLLHESGFNSSNKIRWSMVHRIFDFSHKQAINQDYKGGLMEGNIFDKSKHIKYL